MGRYIYVGPYSIFQLEDGQQVNQGEIVETAMDDHIANLNQRGFHIFREVGPAGTPPPEPPPPPPVEETTAEEPTP